MSKVGQNLYKGGQKWPISDKTVQNHTIFSESNCLKYNETVFEVDRKNCPNEDNNILKSAKIVQKDANFYNNLNN